MRKFFVVKTEKGYVTSGGNDVYSVDSFNKDDAVKFPYDITNEEYEDICNKLHQNGFKNVEFTICFTDDKKISPCPCCGDAWVYHSDNTWYSDYASLGYTIQCRCGYAWKHRHWSDTKEGAVSYWNDMIAKENT